MSERNVRRFAYHNNQPRTADVWPDLCSCPVDCHVDTVGLEFPSDAIPESKLYAAIGAERLFLEDNRIEVNQPRVAEIRFLRTMELHHRAKCDKVHIAFELSPKDLDAAEEWVVTNGLRKSRRHGPMVDFAGGTYWDSINYRGRMPSRDMLEYRRAGKLLTESDVLRLEPRLQTKAAVRQFDIRTVLDLLDLLPAKVLGRFVTFVDDSYRNELEAAIIRQQREAVYDAKTKAKPERRRWRNGREVYSARDQYRGNLHHKIRRVMREVSLGRAQLAMSNLRIRAKKLDMSDLLKRMPRQLSWPD